MTDQRHHRPRYVSQTYVNDDGEYTRVSFLSVFVNHNRVPSKAAGRKGTRRAYKRAHPPGWEAKLWRQIFP